MKSFSVAGYKVRVSDGDFSSVSCYVWHVIKPRGKKYVVRNKQGGGTVYLHRQILAAEPHECIDHKDGNGLNNARSNLRLCTHGQNMCNRVRGSRGKRTSRFKGVWWAKDIRRWRAQVIYKRKTHNLGCFTSEIEAATAYNVGARRIHGRFARLNKIPER
jgi:hypothetical protein